MCTQMVEKEKEIVEIEQEEPLFDLMQSICVCCLCCEQGHKTSSSSLLMP